MYNDFYINSFDKTKYINCLQNINALNALCQNYLLEYSNNVNIEMLFFKESLDHYVCKEILTNQNFIKSIEFKNYVKYIYQVIARKKYVVNVVNQFNLLMEFNTNILFQTLNDNLLISLFGKEVITLRDNNQKYINYLFDKLSKHNMLTQNELTILADYLYNKKEFKNNEHDTFIKYITQNIDKMQINNVISNTILCCLLKEKEINNYRLYTSNNEQIPNQFNNSYAYFKNNNINTLDSFIDFIKKGFYYISKAQTITLNNDSFALYAQELNNYSKIESEDNEICLINKELSLNNTLQFIKKYFGNNEQRCGKINEELFMIKIKRILASLSQGLIENAYLDVIDVQKKIQNGILKLDINSSINKLFDYSGNIKYNELFEHVASFESIGRCLARYMIEHANINDLKAIISNGVCSSNNVLNLVSNLIENLKYYLNLLKKYHELKNSNQNIISLAKNNNLENYYFKLICNEIIKTEEVFKIALSRNFLIDNGLIQNAHMLYDELINEEIQDINKLNQDELFQICSALNKYENLLGISETIQKNANISVKEIISKKEVNEKKAKLKNTLKKHKKIFILAVIILVAVIGIYSYISYASTIRLKNAKMFPNFNKYIEQYVIYTKEDNVEFKCSSFKFNNCNQKVSLQEDLTEHEITNKDNKVYHFRIFKIGQDEASVKIENINGVPTTWTNEAYITVELDNPEYIYTEYSFDGGKTWSDENSIKVIKNTSLDILVKDYFGFNTMMKHLEINKIDDELPSVKITSNKLSDNRIKLEAIASDNISGISSYRWNNNNTNSTITVSSNAKYEVTVYDKAGNASSASITINEQEKEYKASFDNNGKISELSCKTFASSCSVTSPKINGESNTLFGWSKNKDSNTIDVKSGDKITLTKDEKYYLVKNTLLNANFIIQDTSAVGSKNINRTCYFNDKNNSCQITVPSINANKGYEVIGWSQAKNSEKVNVKSGQVMTIDKDVTYYLVTRKSSPLSINFVVQDSNLTTSSKKITCYLYNGDNDCDITMPKLSTSNNKVKIVGWNTNRYAVSSNVSGTIKVNKNTTFYSISSKEATTKTAGNTSITTQLIRVKKYGNSYLEVENGIDENRNTKLVNHLDMLYKDFPQLFYFSGNITFLSESSYLKIDTSDSAGLTSSYFKGSNRSSNIALRWDYTDYFLFALTHELYHAYDNTYGGLFGTDISKASDVNNLFNTYSKMSKSSRPLRDYSYTISEEFIADGFAFYYYSLKSYSTSGYGRAITSDISNVLKKYLDQGLNYYKNNGTIK